MFFLLFVCDAALTIFPALLITLFYDWMIERLNDWMIEHLIIYIHNHLCRLEIRWKTSIRKGNSHSFFRLHFCTCFFICSTIFMFRQIQFFNPSKSVFCCKGKPSFWGNHHVFGWWQLVASSGVDVWHTAHWIQP